MKKQLPEITFRNQDNPNSYFDIVKIESLFERDLDHSIYKHHLVKFYIILFVYEGEGQHTIDFVDYPYQQGTVLLVRKDQIHKFSKSDNVKGYLLVFTEEFIVGHLSRMEALKSMQLFNDSLSFPKIGFNNEEEFADFTILIKHMESEYDAQDDFSVGITRSVLHIVITKLFRIKSREGLFVSRKKYIPEFLKFEKLVEEDCFESRKVQHYATKLGLSPKTLNNVVNEMLNSSAKAFIDERTIMRIKRLLIGTDHPVKEIAYMAGFSDPTNFFKYFKRFTDSSPEAFRQAH